MSEATAYKLTAIRYGDIVSWHNARDLRVSAEVLGWYTSMVDGRRYVLTSICPIPLDKIVERRRITGRDAGILTF